MAYVTAEARQNLLAEVARGIDAIGVALAALGTAYELLDETTADRLEAELFRPVQVAYGRAKRTYDGFAGRHGLAVGSFPPATAPAPSHGVKPLIEDAVEDVARADDTLSELQDSLMPIEIGDQELRAGLAEVRTLLGEIRGRARLFVRTLGR
ncbi:MAG: hypothetical protein JWM71_123 [Solirubrobacteraceae bacterium]|nr:hypothetical protein [Solirubrobacteraceae bacterium]